MQVVLKEHRDNLLGRMVVHGLTNAADQGLIDALAEQYHQCQFLDIIVTANGHEINLESFVKQWQAHINQQVEQAAQRIVSEHFDELKETVDDLHDIVRGEIKHRVGELK